MPLCWIFLLKRRRALSNVSFSPTRISANPGSPPQAEGLGSCAGLAANRSKAHLGRSTRPGPPEHSGGPETGQTIELPTRDSVHAAILAMRTHRLRTSRGLPPAVFSVPFQ